MKHKIIPEGFKDDVSLEVSTEHQFQNLIVEHFQKNGFSLVKTPLIEYSDHNTSGNTFKLIVNKNENNLNIRDDITLQVARLSKTRLSKRVRPLKLCYYGEVVRKEGSMLRPERQFLQIGAECIGENSYLADVEILELAFNSLSLVGIKKITIEISSRVFFDKLVNSIKNHSIKKDIKRFLKIKDLKNILKLLDKKYHKYTIDMFNCTGMYKNKKNELKNLGVDNVTINEINNIKKIVNDFSKKIKNVNIFLDLCEIDDKNYHSGVRFTFFAENIRGEIARGGRYLVDNHENNDATGFTCYMDSILRASSLNLIKKNILLPFNTSSKVIINLQKKGYSILRYTGSFKITKKLANDLNCQFYLFNNSIKKI